MNLKVRGTFLVVFAGLTSLLVLPGTTAAQVKISCKEVDFFHEAVTGRISGTLELIDGKPAGSLHVEFEGSSIRSIALTSATFLHYVQGSALFEGDAIMTIVEGGTAREIVGTFGGYIEDINSTFPERQDSVIFLFDEKDGERLFSSSGLVLRGDILVIDQ